MSQLLYRIGRFAADRPGRVIGAWVLLAIVVVVSSATLGRELEDTFEAPGLDSTAALELLERTESEAAGVTAQVVATPLDDGATFFDPASAAALGDLVNRLGELETVVATTRPDDVLAAGRDEAVEQGAVSPDGRVALVRLQYPVLADVGTADLDELYEVADAARAALPLQIELQGELLFTFEEGTSSATELIGLGVAAVVLLVAFGSLIAMGLPIALAVFGLLLGLSSMTLVAYLIDVPAWAPQIAAMVGLGVGIDYALFVVTRHREFLDRGLTVRDAAGRAIATAGQAVIFAGGTVVIAILGLAVAGVPFVTAAGVAMSVIVAIMVVASITLLPALLGLSGHRINGLRRGRRRRGPVTPTPGHSALSPRWERWGSHVARHAWPYLIGVTALLLALTAPVVALQLGFPGDGTYPESRTERRAFDLVSESFGPGLAGPLVIAVDIADDPAVVEALATAIEGDPGVVSVASVDVDEANGVATILAFPTTAQDDPDTVETIHRLRSDVIAPITSASPATAHVGGPTATFTDIADRIGARLPWFIAAVIALSFLLLTVVFRSILVPLKAALLNLISIGAAYGVLVMVFQWGWGGSLIGLESTVPIVVFIPLFMFAILFGLSMDYEVFLLSRVREEYLVSHDNEASVIRGLAGTARVITSAALIMISVFGGFVVGDDPVVKMLGLGFATAILVDATIVRMILVPASMRLMGDANWWLPGWLDRRLPTIEIDGETALGEPEYEVASPAEPAHADTEARGDRDGGRPDEHDGDDRERGRVTVSAT